MLQRISTPVQAKAWQKSLARAVKSRSQLLALLGIEERPAETAHSPFSLRVPHSYIRRMKKGDPDDPLLRQVLPLEEELRAHPGFTPDPVGDGDASCQSGLLQKYHGRVLIVTTAACPIHCRYCFRRHFPYDQHQGIHKDWQATVSAIAAEPSIGEVILSGGDPLSLIDETLADLVSRLDTLPHLKRLRIHSRYPIVLPERIDETLLGWLGATRLKTTLVIHCNHAQEIDGEVREALGRLRETGVTLLNQAVLLKGVNDDEAALIDLSEALFDAGVLPYYLHMLDRVAGAAHFEVSDEKAWALMEQLRRRLPGYLVPRLVREIAGEAYKRPL